MFRTLAGYGQNLVGLHLMNAYGPNITSYPESSLLFDMVSGPRYESPKDGEPRQVFINPSQYFSGVAPEVRAYRAGGYPSLREVA